MLKLIICFVVLSETETVSRTLQPQCASPGTYKEMSCLVFQLYSVHDQNFQNFEAETFKDTLLLGGLAKVPAQEGTYYVSPLVDADDVYRVPQQCRVF